MPPTLERLAVGRDIVDATAAFLQARGRHAVEGTVLWLGTVESDVAATVTQAFVPEQVAYRTRHGLAVEVTREALRALIEQLPPGVFVLARVHSHGGAAYHSQTDDDNMVISHEGAISIVVPYFARDGLDLARCSVNQLRRGHGWTELTAEEVAARFELR